MPPALPLPLPLTPFPLPLLPLASSPLPLLGVFPGVQFQFQLRTFVGGEYLGLAGESTLHAFKPGKTIELPGSAQHAGHLLQCGNVVIGFGQTLRQLSQDGQEMRSSVPRAGSRPRLRQRVDNELRESRRDLVR